MAKPSGQRAAEKSQATVYWKFLIYVGGFLQTIHCYWLNHCEQIGFCWWAGLQSEIYFCFLKHLFCIYLRPRHSSDKQIPNAGIDHKGTSVLLKTPLTLFEVRGKHFWEVVHTFGRWYIAPTDTPLKGKLPHLLFLSNPLFLWGEWWIISAVQFCIKYGPALI